MNQLVCGGLFKLFFLYCFFLFFLEKLRAACLESLPVPYVLNLRTCTAPSSNFQSSSSFFHISVLFCLILLPRPSAIRSSTYCISLERTKNLMSLRHSPRTRIAAATDWRRRCSADEGRRSGALLVAAISAINNALDALP